MKTILFNNRKFPFTGRIAPKDAELSIIIVNPKWLDLVWHDKKRDVFVYLSTLPA